MFDGNFRSRREVNLGNNNRSRRRGAGSRQTQRVSGGQPNRDDLLTNAATLRKQRQDELRQKNAARNIQRNIRGWRSRRSLAQELGLRMDELKDNQTGNLRTNWETIASMRLSRWLRPFLSNLRRELLNCAAIHSSQLALVRTESSSSQRDSLWVSRKRIVHATLQAFRPHDDGDDLVELQSLFSILESYFEAIESKPKIDNSLFLDLVLCTRVWWMKQATCAENGVTPWYDDKTRSLFRWSSQSAQGLSSSDQALAWALLSSVIMGISGLFRPEQFHRLQPLLPPQVQSDKAAANYYCFTTLFLPLASSLEHCTAAAIATDGSTGKVSSNLLLQATLDNFKGHETIILSNALDLCQHSTDANLDPQPLIRLFHHVLSQRPDLAMLSSLVVRGEDLRTLVSTSSAAEQNDAAAGGAENILDDDSDDEDEREESSTAQGSAAATPSSPRTSIANKKSRKSSGSRYTRQELLTLPKLDRRYQDEVLLYRKEYLTSLISRNDEHMVELASKIGTAASTWKEWGLILLDHQNVTSINANARDSYLALLGLLLQSSTGLRTDSTVASSTFMSQFAFHQELREKLWFYVRQPNSTPTSLAVFCDVFCHYLIPLSDAEFLKNHTQGTNRYPSQILAEEVIVHLRDVLYDLYWNKPVLAVDVSLNSTDGGRGRLLLAGTKLWNSLYERWNRLVRDSPFCDESTWWFPHMSSREGDGAVIPSRERRSSDDDEDYVEPMDIDGDEDDGDDDRQISRSEAEADALADSFRDAKMARVLTCIPQSLPFDRRVKLFHSLLKADKLKTQNEAMQYRRAVAGRMFDGEDATFDFLPAREQVQIHRTNLYSDSMQKLNALGPRLKRKVQVSFINQHGVAEAGIDGGGVFKEFLDDLIKEAFSTDQKKRREAPRLFSVTPLQTLAVNGSLAQENPLEMQNLLEHYTYLGRVLGKALYESILVEPQFCLPFLNQLLGKANSLEDLKTFDKEMYTNLTKLREYSSAELEALDLSFELTIGDASASKTKFRNVELVRGGQSKIVTKDNVIQYIHLVANHRLNVQGYQQTKAFLQGFRDLIPASWVRLFSAHELQKLISGDDTVRGIDVASLKRVMQYSAGYHPSQPYIQYFWEILENDLTPQQQKKFLKFMTSCSRQPLLGFGSLEPPPCVQQIRIAEDEAGTKNSRLPTSSTCLNLLKLPNYHNKERLRAKLLAAIEAEAGFELT